MHQGLLLLDQVRSLNKVKWGSFMIFCATAQAITTKLGHRLVSFPDRFFLFLFVVAEKRVWWISVGTFVLL